MAKNVLILGAGVEKAKGIDFPLAVQLLPEIVAFTETDEGKTFDEELRKCLPNLRFNLKTFIKSAVDNFSETTTEEIEEIILKLEPIIDGKIKDGEPRKALLLKKLLERVKSIRDGGKIDDETFNLIKEVLGEEAITEISDESIISFKKLDFTDSFKVVIKHILRESITKPLDPIGNVLGSKILDFEKILIDTFLGFYLEKDTEIKKYLYVSWMLWAYLTSKNNEVNKNFAGKDIPFYSELKSLNSIDVITFNYTSFLEDELASKNMTTLYFHGYLKEYIRLDNRDFLKIEKTQLEDPISFFKDNISATIDFSNKVYLIPGIIPPLRLKPVLSQEFIERWHKANELIRAAKIIVIIGYSFAYADEHFNDLIRKNSDKEIIIINPAMDFMRDQICRILGKNPNDFTKAKWKSKYEMFQARNIKVIAAKAEDIDLVEVLK